MVRITQRLLLAVSLALLGLTPAVVHPLQAQAASTPTVYAWGSNSSGQLGNGTTTDSSTPVTVGGLLAEKTVTAVAGGTGHSLALTSDGKVYAWGYNLNGQLGNGTTTNSSTPVLVSMPKTVTAIAASWNFSLALASDGTVYGWGYNYNGQLGNGTTTDSSTPVQVAGLLTGKTVTAIAAGFFHSLALTNEGKVYSWGSNHEGQLGNGTTTNSSTPVLVGGLLAGKTVTAIGAGSDAVHSLAVVNDGTVYTWGDNDYGQLGNGDSGLDHRSTVPVQVTGLPAEKTMTAVAGSILHSLALASDGTVYAWGSQRYGELGDGTSDWRSITTTPVLVTGLLAGKTVTAIAAGSGDSLVLTSSGAVYAWGRNDYGELGNNSTTDSSIPVLVGLPNTMTAISAGLQHSLAVGLPPPLTAPGAPVLATGSSTPNQGSFTLSWNPATGGTGNITYTLQHKAQGSPDSAFTTVDDTLPTASYSFTSGNQEAEGAWVYRVLASAGTESSVWSTASSAVTVDRTPPTNVVATPSRNPDHNGWYTAPFDVSWSGQDTGSGVESCTGATTYDGPDTATGSMSGTCTDKAGNTSPAVNFSFKYSTVAPTANPAITGGTAGSNGWYTSDATVDWNWSDTTSGIDPANCTTTSTSTGEGSITLSATCHNLAGNEGHASQTVKVDKTPPTNVTPVPSRDPDYNGWYTAPFDVNWSGQDGVSDVDSCTGTTYSDPDTASGSVSGTCTDKAGNTSAPVSFSFKYTTTGPTASPIISAGTAGNGDWYTSDVTIDWNWSDTTSGIDPANCTTASTSSGEGSVTLSATCQNLAGKVGQASQTVKVDKTPPTVTCQADSFVFGQSGATVSATVSDDTSGAAQSPVSGSADTSSVGSAFTVPLTGSDQAGNSTTEDCPYSVDKAATTTSVTSSGIPYATLGQEVTFTATVGVNAPGAGTPTGSVAFYDGTTLLGTKTLNSSGVATLTTSNLTSGSHSITATYNGDTNFTASPASDAITQLVQYKVQLLYKEPFKGNVGSTVPIKLELTNASGQNLSSPSLQVQALCVVATPVASSDPCASAPTGFNWTDGTPQYFTYGPKLARGGGYQFNVKTTGLSVGPTYQLLFRVAGEPDGIYHADANATFTLTK